VDYKVLIRAALSIPEKIKNLLKNQIKNQKMQPSLWDWCHNPCFSSVSWCNFHHKNTM